MPGLFFIDTPGHEAFTTLRKRGGALADLAILIVDIKEGFKPQTYEALNILKMYKTPFIVAANKIDKIYGWEVHEGLNIHGNLLKTGIQCSGKTGSRAFMNWWESYMMKDLNLRDSTGLRTLPNR